jgi:hypothetical protein
MKRNPLLGAAAGAVGGLLGSWMMIRFQHLIGQNGASPEDRERPHQHRRQEAQPNDTDGTIPDEPATMQAASAISEAFAGRPLDEREKEIGGSILHYMFGVVVGAMYGAAAEAEPQTSRAAGLPFGTAVWLVAGEIGVPLAGLSSKPTQYPITRHAAALASHLVYGLTVEGVRRALRGIPSEVRTHRPH